LDFESFLRKLQVNMILQLFLSRRMVSLTDMIFLIIQEYPTYMIIWKKCQSPYRKMDVKWKDMLFGVC